MTDECSDAKPSEVHAISFLYATNNSINYPPPVEGKSGKWIIFLKEGEELDTMWRTILQALHEGKLGRRAKVSTMKSSFHRLSQGKGFICVYTYDSNDREDTMRIRSELHTLGITWKIPYPLDKHVTVYTNEGEP